MVKKVQISIYVVIEWPLKHPSITPGQVFVKKMSHFLHCGNFIHSLQKVLEKNYYLFFMKKLPKLSHKYFLSNFHMEMRFLWPEKKLVEI